MYGLPSEKFKKKTLNLNLTFKHFVFLESTYSSGRRDRFNITRTWFNYWLVYVRFGAGDQESGMQRDDVRLQMCAPLAVC